MWMLLLIISLALYCLLRYFTILGGTGSIETYWKIQRLTPLAIIVHVYSIYQYI